MRLAQVILLIRMEANYVNTAFFDEVFPSFLDLNQKKNKLFKQNNNSKKVLSDL